MAAHAHLLSEDAVTIIEAYLGVEDYVGYYFEDGLRLVHGQRERRNLQLAWGMEELKHAESWELVLLHSGRRTAEQLATYRDRVSAHTWRMRELHPGLISLAAALLALSGAAGYLHLSSATPAAAQTLRIIHGAGR